MLQQPTKVSSDQDFWVIGVGASAGGLEALTSFVKELPEDSKAMFIVAQHLAPHSKSMMVELLSRQTKLPVIALENKFKIRPGIIGIIPPNYDATFQGNGIQLAKAGEETRPKPSVDTLFRSLAENFGKKAVGIILSGTGSDGAEGMRAVKEHGGIALSQDNISAKYDGMPRAAQDRALMDEVLPATELGKRLFEILDEHSKAPTMAPLLSDSPYLKEILQLVKETCNNDFSEYKIPTIARRIEKRMTGFGFSSHEEYLRKLKDDPNEVSSLMQELLVSVTSFFRDPDAYNVLDKELTPLVAERSKSGEELRIWVAACATGEEAYSLAILILKIAKRLQLAPPPMKIFATDLDGEAISHARIGLYSDSEIAGLEVEDLKNYFERRDRFYEVKRILRDVIVFARQNLIQNPPFVKLDLISCRNVLIYFDTSLQKRVFDIFQYSLKPGALLFLGKSESAPSLLFEVVDRKTKIFKKLNLVPSRVPHPIMRNHTGVGGIVHAPDKRKAEASSLEQLVPQQLLREYRITGIVVDEDSIIYHTLGDLSKFVKMPSGIPDFRLTNLVPRTVSTELAVLIRKSKKDGKPHRSREYPQIHAKNKNYTFIVRPLVQPVEATKKVFLVSFQTVQLLQRKRTKSSLASTDLHQRVADLEHELATTKEHLQTLVEELEISNEEMQSMNEELSSTNEELQASNEELETTNEELQSTNEELMTVNEELNAKTSELKLANLSLENIQNSIGAPLLVVDSNLRVQSFNSDANKIFILAISDIGRPVAEVSCQCEIPDFNSKLKTAVSDGVITETFCEQFGNLYQVRIHPNRDERGKITGAVIVFFNNSEIIRAQDRLRASDANIRAIIDGSPALISLKDLMGRYLVVNRAFQRIYGVTEEQMLGKTDREIFPDSYANLVRDYDLEVLLKRENTEHQETVLYQGKEYIYSSNRFPLQNSKDGAPQVVGTVSLDITAQIKAQDALRASEARYRAIVEEQAVLVCRYRPDGTLTFTNSAFCAFFGGTPESNLKRTLQSYIESDDRSKVSRELNALTPEHSVTQYETKVVCPMSTGSRFVRWIHRAIFNETGTLIELQAVGFDVTELHHQTNYLLQKENLFSHVLEHTSDYLTVYKLDGDDFVLESFNPSAARNRSQGHHRLIGRKLSQLTDSANSEHVIQKYHECARTEKVITFEEEIASPRGSIFLLTTLVPILDQNYRTERIAALGRDITHLKRVEQALREQKRSSDAANQAKSDFLTAMSHELRTPLGVISGMTQLLARDTLATHQQKYLTTIQQSSKTLLALIEDVLDISKIEAGKLGLDEHPFRLADLLNEVAQPFEVHAKQKSLDFKTHFVYDESLFLRGDYNRLKQILVNLLGNAIKFTEKGLIELSVEVSTGVSQSYARLDFAVKDTGIGIPKESVHRIFNRFSQADSGIARKFGGTGLGLAISKQLIELMDGQIGFNSKPGEGSLFWFNLELPLARSDADKKDEALSDQQIDLSHLTVLAVDDNIDSLQLLELFLNERVKKVHAATNAEDGIRLLEKHPIDLVVMDIQMPKIDGMEATRMIRKLGSSKKSVPIIAVTANAMSGDRERFLASGMDDYVSKPIDFSILFRTLFHWSQKKHE